MILQPGTWITRVVALGGLVGALALFALFIIVPLATWRAETKQAVAIAYRDIGQLNSSLATLTVERDQLQATSMDGFLWSARQTGAATAQVQAAVGELALQRGLSIRAITPTGERSLPLAPGVGFRAEMEATLDQLAPFLVSLEYHTPALAVERAELRRITRLGTTETEQPTLFVQLDLVAPLLISEADQ